MEYGLNEAQSRYFGEIIRTQPHLVSVENHPNYRRGEKICLISAGKTNIGSNPPAGKQQIRVPTLSAYEGYFIYNADNANRVTYTPKGGSVKINNRQYEKRVLLRPGDTISFKPGEDYYFIHKGISHALN